MYLEIKVDCRDAIYQPEPLLADFIDLVQSQLSPEEQDEVRAWERHVSGYFVLLRHLKKHSIFLNMEEPAKAYGVLSLTTDLAELIPDPPIIIETVLLPFRGVVLCDGLVAAGPLVGRNMERGIHETYMQTKRAGELITAL